MSVSLSVNQWLTLHGVVTLLALLWYVISSHAMLLRRGPAEAIAWVFFILSIPYVALPVYLVFGSRKMQRRSSVSIPVVPRAESTGGWAVQTALALGQAPPAEYRELDIHIDGAHALAALLETIGAARHCVDLCTFIIRADATGDAVMDRLCERARNGVRVRVLIDGVGRRMATGPDMQRLVDAGGEWALFVPPLRALLNGSANLRNHRKLVVADGGHAAARLWAGGRNIGAEYFEGHAGMPPWRDLSFDVRGAVVDQASTLFAKDWQFATRQSAGATQAPAREMRACVRGAQLLASGPDQADDTLHAMLLTAAFQARERILLATPYFVPDAALVAALNLAARRGVSIELLVPAHSNHRLSDLARSRALRSLAEVGVKIGLVSGMFHAKLVVIDDTLALAGSANLDTRSLFLNYEVMLAFHAAVDVERFAVWFGMQSTDCTAYSGRRPGTIRDVGEGLLLWIAFEL